MQREIDLTRSKEQDKHKQSRFWSERKRLIGISMALSPSSIYKVYIEIVLSTQVAVYFKQSYSRLTLLVVSTNKQDPRALIFIP